MPDNSIAGVLGRLSQMRQPYAAPDGGPQYVVPQQSLNLQPSGITDAQGKPIGVTGSQTPSAIPGVPPWMTGVYRMFYPTPAETGELPPQYWPQKPPG